MRSKIIILILLNLIISSGTHIFSELIIKQARDGRIIVSNRPDIIFSSKNKMATFIKPSSPSMSIPLVYMKKISALTEKYGLSKNLVLAIIKAESDFNTYALSKKGAAGLMQLMKKTALQYGVSNRYDAHQNLEAGIKHLKYLYKKYKGNLNLTLAAYNAGETAVNKYGGIPPYRETKNYIRKVRKYMGSPAGQLTFNPKKTKIFKYYTREGRIVLSDTPPPNAIKRVEIFD